MVTVDDVAAMQLDWMIGHACSAWRRGGRCQGLAGAEWWKMVCSSRRRPVHARVHAPASAGRSRSTALPPSFPLPLCFPPQGTSLVLGPLNYLFVHTFNSGKYCLGVFDNGRNGGSSRGGRRGAGAPGHTPTCAQLPAIPRVAACIPRVCDHHPECIFAKCVLPSPAGTLLGGITFRNVLVRYDRANKQVGFGPGQ